jgi:BRCT domain type II-containing protein
MSDLDVADTDTTESTKKPKAAKSTAKKTATKRKTTASKSTRSRKKPASIKISDEQRLSMIAEAAYFKAEQRGFAGGNPVEDWLAAESEVDALLSDNPAQQISA